VRPRSRGACCVADSLPRAVKRLGGGGRDGCCAASVAVRSLHRVRPRHWQRVCTSTVARCQLRPGLFAAGSKVVGRRRTRRLSRGVLCRAFPAPRDVQSLCGGGSGGCCAAFVAARCRRCVRPRRWVVADAAVVARRLSPRVPGAAGGQVVGGGQARRRPPSVCCRAVPAPRDVKSLCGGRRGGGCAAFVAARSWRGGWSSRWGGAGASAVARRLLPRVPGPAGGQVVGGRRARRWLRGVCRRAFPARRAVKRLGGGHPCCHVQR